MNSFNKYISFLFTLLLFSSLSLKAQTDNTDDDWETDATNGTTTNSSVGIGVSIPQEKLHVYDGNLLINNSSNQNEIMISNKSVTATNNNLKLVSTNDQVVIQGTGLTLNKSGVNNKISIEDNYGVGYSQLTGQDYKISYNSEDRVYLSSNGVSYLKGGNVGIGLANPSVSLEILGLMKLRDGETGPSSSIATSGGGNLFIKPATGLLQLNKPGGQFLVGLVGNHSKLDETKMSVHVSNISTLLLNGAGDSYLNGGNVGIGTDAPNATLDVQGDLAIGSGGYYDDVILRSGEDITGYYGVFEVVPYTIPGTGIAKHLTYFKNVRNSGTGKTEHSVAIDGKLGVGTSNPWAVAHLKAENSSEITTLLRLEHKADAGLGGASIEFGGNSGTNGLSKISGLNVLSSSVKSKLRFETMGHDGSWNSIVMSSEGYLGIGVPDELPLEALDVNGAIKIGTTVTPLAELQGGEVKYENGVFSGFNKESNTWVAFGSGDASSESFLTPLTAYPNFGNTIVELDPNKVLKIGNGNKEAYAMLVEGKIGTRSLQLNIEGDWPDYVFEENYSMLTLQELQRYVKTEKHLPGVPKADVVAQEGVNVGDLNKVMLEKIEELTLYILQQEKRIKDLEAKAAE